MSLVNFAALENILNFTKVAKYYNLYLAFRFSTLLIINSKSISKKLLLQPKYSY